MSNFGTMRSRITSELNRPDLSTQAASSIKTAISHYESERFYFSEGRAYMVTVDGQEYYPLPDDFQKADAMTYLYGTNRYTIEEKPWVWIEWQRVNTNYKSSPDYFSIYAEQLRFYPVPDDAYTVYFGYQKRLSDLSASADTNSWMTDGEEMIRMHAKVDLLANLIQGPEAIQLANFYRTMEEQAASRLRLETSRRRATGKVQAYCYGE